MLNGGNIMIAFNVKGSHVIVAIFIWASIINPFTIIGMWYWSRNEMADVCSHISYDYMGTLGINVATTSSQYVYGNIIKAN